ncbi:uncharacterized protein LOC119598728 [Penaeus monodon]|uniref:uncharacterized protein LOC119598728 n=1 Tax=Penaeus monodon TaxID=6687 RepID=UPI0018A79758|nr:uncharacterized protein LOC119598728 [Penaeus monodon]
MRKSWAAAKATEGVCYKWSQGSPLGFWEDGKTPKISYLLIPASGDTFVNFCHCKTSSQRYICDFPTSSKKPVFPAELTSRLLSTEYFNTCRSLQHLLQLPDACNINQHCPASTSRARRPLLKPTADLDSRITTSLPSPPIPGAPSLARPVNEPISRTFSLSHHLPTPSVPHCTSLQLRPCPPPRPLVIAA